MVETSQANVLRGFGIDLVGAVPWGTHLCQFYESKEDLIDILVPYFAEGLRNNEFCMWVTSPPLEVEEATEALRTAVPDLAEYFRKGQIEIISYDDWYMLGGEFDSNRVLQGWVEKETAALKRGFAGLRLTGNTFWIERSLWKSFVDYEEAVNAVIGEHKMIAVCTYCLTKCTGTDVLDVIRNHVGTLVKEGDKWYLVEDAARRKAANGALRLSEHRYSALFENMQDGFAYHKILLDEAGKPVDYVFLEINDAFERLTGLKREKVLGKAVTQVLPGIERDPANWIGVYGKVALTGEPVRLENYSKALSRWYVVSAYSPEKSYFAATFEDITERKKAEEALRESEQRWATTLSSIGDAVIATDVEGKVTFMNAVAEKLTGWTLNKAKHKPLKEVFNIVNEQTRREVENPVSRVLKEGMVIGLANHTILRRKDGTEIPIDDSGAPIRDKDGNVTGVVLVFRDITERKQMEEELRKSRDELETRVKERTADLSKSNERLKKEVEERMRTEQSLKLEEARLDALLRLSQIGEATLKEIANFTLEQAIALTNSKIGFVGFLTEDETVYTLHAVSKDVVKECSVTGDPMQWHVVDAGTWADAIREHRTLFVNDYSKPHPRKKGFPPGHPYVRKFMVVPILEGHRIVAIAGVGNKASDYDKSDERQTVLLMKGMLSNVQKAEAEQKEKELIQAELRERKLSEEKLREASLYARSLLEASLDPLVTINAEGKVTDVNKATERITGVSRERLIGSDFSDYFTEPEKARAGYIKTFMEGFVRDYPLVIRHVSGKITDVLYNATVYRDENWEVQGVFAAARDITELKKAEERAQESARKLKDAERLVAIGQTAGMVGHDIRNPLQAILGDLYLVKSDLASLPEGAEKESMKESLTEIEANIDYIDKIVQDLQDYSRPLKPSLQVLNLEELCNEVLQKNSAAKNIESSCQVKKEAKKIVSDATLLRRILTNLKNNAVQAMPDGGNLEIDAYKDAEDIVVTVHDTGLGIPEEIKPQLFRPLFTTKSKGQGFGLAVVKRMTEALGGTVNFESEEGRGTKFIVRLPFTTKANGK
jgi:PAS domain S-box-containing protein